MSESRDLGTAGGHDQPRRSRWPATTWLLSVLAVVAVFAAGAVLFFNLGIRSAQPSAGGDIDALREELQGTTQSLRETKSALRALQETKPAAASGDAQSQVVAAQKRLAARLLVDQVMYARHWEALEVNEGFKPVVQDLVKRLSKQEYASRSIHPHASEGPNAPRDEFERDLLARFTKDRPSEKRSILFAERDSAGQSRYEYYQAVYAEKSCLLCHNTGKLPFDLGGGSVTPVAAVSGGAPVQNVVPLKEGDLMAIVQVVVPAPRDGGK